MTADYHHNLAGEFLQRKPRRTLRACWWQPGHGWQVEQDFPARPAQDIAGLRHDLARLALSYPGVGYFNSTAGTYTPAMVRLIRDTPGSLPRPVYPDSLRLGKDEPP